MLSYERGVVQVGVSMNGRTVNIFSTHVDYYNSSYRTTQISQAKSWISGFSSPRIVMGDFNTSPGTSDYNLMASAYADAWAVGRAPASRPPTTGPARPMARRDSTTCFIPRRLRSRSRASGCRTHV